MATFDLSGSTSVLIGEVEKFGPKTVVITRSGNITVGGLISNLSSTSDLSIGMTVTGTGVVGGSTIASIPGSTSVQLDPSSGHTAGTGVSFTFTRPAEPDAGMNSNIKFFDPRSSTRTLVTKRLAHFVNILTDNWTTIRAVKIGQATQAIVIAITDAVTKSLVHPITHSITISSSGDGLRTRGGDFSSSIIIGHSSVLGVSKSVGNTSNVTVQSGGYTY
jgi:hypothetical protein